MLFEKTYKMPLIYDIYEAFIGFKSLFKKSKELYKEKHNEVHEMTLKV